MTDNPTPRPTGLDEDEGEEAATRDIAPELHNDEQDDEDAQAQTLADEASGRTTSSFGLGDTEKVGGGIEDDNGAPDLVDRMRQMETSGHIDMGAFLGERSDDDEDGSRGETGIDNVFPRGSE